MICNELYVELFCV